MTMIPLAHAVGLDIVCPDPGCGRRCRVEPSRVVPPGPGAMPRPINAPAASPGVSLAHQYAIVHCPRTGARSLLSSTLVELYPDGG